MAIWQFTFYLVPRDSVERLHGSAVLILEAFAPIEFEEWTEGKEHPNYWVGRSPISYAAQIEGLLPARKSWSQDALMFGDEDGDDIDLWEDDIRVRLDLRNFNHHLAQGVVHLAADEGLMLVMGQTGRLIPPNYEKLIREIGQSRSARFVMDPVETLRMIGREAE